MNREEIQILIDEAINAERVRVLRAFDKAQKELDEACRSAHGYFPSEEQRSALREMWRNATLIKNIIDPNGYILD